VRPDGAHRTRGPPRLPPRRSERSDRGRPLVGRRPPQESAPQDDEAPPITQEDDGVGDLDSEEEEFDEDDDDDDGLERRSIANDRTDGGRPKEDDDEELDAARDEATHTLIPACPRGTKRDGGENDRTYGGGRPKKSLPKTTGDLDDVDEELDDGDIGDLDDDDKKLDDGDIEDDEGLKDEGKTAPVMLAGPPPPTKWPRGAGRKTSPYELVLRSLGNQEAIHLRTS